jgi:hypothetical protein
MAMAAGRAGRANGPDFPTAVDPLDENTSDLAGGAGMLAQAAGQQFISLGADHVDELIAYTTWLAGTNTGRRDAALSKLHGFDWPLRGIPRLGCG